MAVAAPEKEIFTPSPEMLEAQFAMPSPDGIPEIEHVPAGERYGLSLSCIKAAGAAALEGSLGLDSGAVKQLRGEFDACVFEGLSSDGELGDGLRVTKFDSWQVRNGKVISGDGETPVSELVNNGYETSRRDAEKDFRVATQAHRDKNDLFNAHEVDAMVSGRRDYDTRIVISAAPMDAMRRDGEQYWYGKGYVKDQHYIQMYHWNGQELVTAALSFKAKDMGKVRRALREQGADIPDDAKPDDIINYALTFNAAEEEAKAKALSLRKGAEGTAAMSRDTVDMVENRRSMDTAFSEMYLPVAISSAVGKKTPRTAEIVSVFLENSQYFSPEVRGRLMSIDARDDFTDEDTRLLHQLSTYAAIERVRAELSGETAYTGTGVMPSYDYAPADVHAAAASFINQMGEFIQIGSSAGRTYSSCGAALKLVNDALKEFEIPSLQDVFGGKAEEKDSDEKGSLYFVCENNHPNRRPYGKTIDCCTTCGVSVACQIK